MSPGDQLIGIDLFCGAGGFSLGFEQAGFHVAAAVDSYPPHVATHAKNFPTCRTIGCDISKMSGEWLRKEANLEGKTVHVLFGGSPCQGFSLIGRRDAADERNLLLLEFGRLVDELRPMYFVLENVEGLLVGTARQLVDRFTDEVEAADYSVVRPIRALDASDFGVPQSRRRVFVLGHQKTIPAPTYPESCLLPQGKPTVWDAIGDLSVLRRSSSRERSDTFRGELGTATWYSQLLRSDTAPSDIGNEHSATVLTGCRFSHHEPKIVARFEATAPGSSEPVSRFYRLEMNGVAPTLRAGTDQSHGSFTAPRPIHPTQPRCITVREAARLHSFPDNFIFNGTIWHGFRQIGNAVPPFLGRAIANSIYDALATIEGVL